MKLKRTYYELVLTHRELDTGEIQTVVRSNCIFQTGKTNVQFHCCRPEVGPGTFFVGHTSKAANKRLAVLLSARTEEERINRCWPGKWCLMSAIIIHDEPMPKRKQKTGDGT